MRVADEGVSSIGWRFEIGVGDLQAQSGFGGCAATGGISGIGIKELLPVEKATLA